MPPLPSSPSTHPLALSHPNSSFSYLLRTPLWFGVLLTPGTSLPPANQPTNQPAKSFSDVAPTDKWSALGLPACGHYWSMRFSVLLPSFSRHFFYPSFFPSHLSFYTSFHRLSDLPYLPSIPPCPYLHFILRHAPLLSFSFPEDTHSFVTIVGNGEEVDESMANVSSWLVLIWL